MTIRKGRGSLRSLYVVSIARTCWMSQRQTNKYHTLPDSSCRLYVNFITRNVRFPHVLKAKFSSLRSSFSPKFVGPFRASLIIGYIPPEFSIFVKKSNSYEGGYIKLGGVR